MGGRQPKMDSHHDCWKGGRSIFVDVKEGKRGSLKKLEEKIHPLNLMEKEGDLATGEEKILSEKTPPGEEGTTAP